MSLTVAAHAAVEGIGRAAGFGVVVVYVTDCGRKSVTPGPGSCGNTQKQAVQEPFRVTLYFKVTQLLK